VEAAARRRQRNRTDHKIRCLRSFLPDCRSGPPRGWRGRHLQSRSLDGTEGTAPSRRFHPLRHGRCEAGARRCQLAPARLRRRGRERRSHRLRHRRHRGNSGNRSAIARARSAPRIAFLHTRPDHQSRLGLRLDCAFAERAQSRRGHRLLDRRSRHRRCRQAHCPRRCRRDGGRRHRISGEPHIARRLCRMPGAIDAIQPDAAPRLAAI